MNCPEPVVRQGGRGLSITSLVLGVLSVLGFAMLTGIPAMITGIVALTQKRLARGVAIAGLVTGLVGSIVTPIVVLTMLLPILLLTGQQGDTRPVDVRAFTRNTEIRLGRIERDAVDVRHHYGAEAEGNLAQVDQRLATARSVLRRMQNVSDETRLRRMREEVIEAYRAAQDILAQFE